MTSAFKTIKRILWIILFANFAVAFAKIGLGYLTQSASVLADGFHSLTDGSGNIIGLVGMSFASKPVDSEHPYGHHKYETLSSLMIVGMLFFLALQIISEAIGKFTHPVIPTIDIWTFAVMLSTLAINLFVTVYEYNAGKKLHSTLLIGDALHTRSDVFVTIGVILSLVMVKLGLPVWIDPLVSLVVAGVILFAAVEIFRMASAILLDSKVVDEKVIAEVVSRLPEVKGVHHIRSRGTLTNLFIDMDVLLDPEISLISAHYIAHTIERVLQDHFKGSMVQVITHLEPYNPNHKSKKISEKTA